MTSSWGIFFINMCKYAIDKSTFTFKTLLCSVNNLPCPYCRFCKTKGEMVMLYGYENCQNKKMEKDGDIL